jgi:amidase
LSSRVSERTIPATEVVVSEFWRLDATAQAALVREKSVRPAELVDAAITRVERLNPKLNAVVTEMFDRARAEAAVAPADGPFAGVPFLLKDLLAEYAGVPLTEGSAFLDGRYTPEVDSELMRRLRRAGLIVIGKTNTPELGILPTTEPRLFGPTRNPWSLDRTPGARAAGRRLPWRLDWSRWPTRTTAAGRSVFPRRAAGSLVSSPRAAAPPWARTTATSSAGWWSSTR